MRPAPLRVDPRAREKRVSPRTVDAPRRVSPRATLQTAPKGIVRRRESMESSVGARRGGHLVVAHVAQHHAGHLVRERVEVEAPLASLRGARGGGALGRKLARRAGGLGGRVGGGRRGRRGERAFLGEAAARGGTREGGPEGRFRSGGETLGASGLVGEASTLLVRATRSLARRRLRLALLRLARGDAAFHLRDAESLRVRRGGLLADPARHLEREVGVLLAHRANVHREGLHLLRQRYGRRALVRVRGVAQAPPARTNGQRGEGTEAMRTWSRLGSGCRRGRVGRTTERTKADVVIPSRGTHAFWWYRNCRQSSSNSSHSACMRSWSSSSDAILAAPSSQATPAAPREGILAAPPTASDNTRKFARRDSPAVSENVSFSISL